MFLPGAIALWVAFFALVASTYFYVRSLRGHTEARAWARQAYGLATTGVLIAARRPALPHPDPRLPNPLRVLVLRPLAAHPLPDLDLLGRAGGQLPAVADVGNGRRPAAHPLRAALRGPHPHRLQPRPALAAPHPAASSRLSGSSPTCRPARCPRTARASTRCCRTRG